MQRKRFLFKVFMLYAGKESSLSLSDIYKRRSSVPMKRQGLNQGPSVAAILVLSVLALNV